MAKEKVINPFDAGVTYKDLPKDFKPEDLKGIVTDAEIAWLKEDLEKFKNNNKKTKEEDGN